MKRLRRYWWWFRMRQRGRFLLKDCRLQILEDQTLLITGLDGDGVALWVSGCHFDTLNLEGDDAFFQGNWDIDRLLESDSPVKILMRGPTSEQVDRELEDFS